MVAVTCAAQGTDAVPEPSWIELALAGYDSSVSEHQSDSCFTNIGRRPMFVKISMSRPYLDDDCPMGDLAATLVGASIGVLGTILGGVITWISQSGERKDANRREDHRRWEQPVLELGVELLTLMDRLIEVSTLVVEYGQVDEFGEQMIESATAAYHGLRNGKSRFEIFMPPRVTGHIDLATIAAFVLMRPSTSEPSRWLRARDDLKTHRRGLLTELRIMIGAEPAAPPAEDEPIAASLSS